MVGNPSTKPFARVACRGPRSKGCAPMPRYRCRRSCRSSFGAGAEATLREVRESPVATPPDYPPIAPRLPQIHVQNRRVWRQRSGRGAGEHMAAAHGEWRVHRPGGGGGGGDNTRRRWDARRDARGCASRLSRGDRGRDRDRCLERERHRFLAAEGEECRHAYFYLFFLGSN